MPSESYPHRKGFRPLSVEEQTEEVLFEALQEVVDSIDVRGHPDGQHLELLDEQGIVLLVIERPKLISTSSELARLYPGSEISAPDSSRGAPDLFRPGTTGSSPPSPVWWQDLHAAAKVPRTDELADALAHAVARRTQGVVIVPRTVPAPPRTEPSHD
jgi:hypothetical protein